MPTHYFVHVARAGAENYARGINALTWGWKDSALDKRNTAFGGVRNRDLATRVALGDVLVLGHRGPDPRQLSAQEYARGQFKQVSVFSVVRRLYTAHTPVWDDEVYPNRVDLAFLEQGEGWGAEQLGADGMEALQRSANAAGVAIPGTSGPLPYESAALQEVFADPVNPDETYDAYTWSVRRREQSRLRARKLAGRADAPCDLCGRTLPASMLRAAHIKRRADCSPLERADSKNVMLACVLGCDALFELGHLCIDAAGDVAALKPATGDLQAAIQPLIGRQATRSPQVLHYAQAHRNSHAAASSTAGSRP